MKLITSLVISLCSTGAYAYGDHSGWSSSRGGYSDSYQFITQTEILHTTSKVEDEKGTTSTTQYKGMGLKTGIGVELVKFVRFDAYHLYRDTSNNPSVSLRGSEVGGNIKLNFYGPVVNVEFGFGLFADSLVDQRPEQSSRYFGNGYTGSLGFERFFAQKASFVFTVKGQQEELRPEETSNETRPKLTTVGAALGLLLWLN